MPKSHKDCCLVHGSGEFKSPGRFRDFSVFVIPSATCLSQTAFFFDCGKPQHHIKEKAVWHKTTYVCPTSSGKQIATYTHTAGLVCLYNALLYVEYYTQSMYVMLMKK